MTLAIIDWDALFTVVWASLAAGIGVTAAFGFALLGATRAVEFGRDGRVGGATAFGILGGLGIAVVIAAIVFGILVLAD